MFLNNLDKDTKNIDIWLIFHVLILFIELFRHIISFYNEKKLIFFILFGKNVVHSYRYKS